MLARVYRPILAEYLFLIHIQTQMETGTINMKMIASSRGLVEQFLKDSSILGV